MDGWMSPLHAALGEIFLEKSLTELISLFTCYSVWVFSSLPALLLFHFLSMNGKTKITLLKSTALWGQTPLCPNKWKTGAALAECDAARSRVAGCQPGETDAAHRASRRESVWDAQRVRFAGLNPVRSRLTAHWRVMKYCVSTWFRWGTREGSLPKETLNPIKPLPLLVLVSVLPFRQGMGFFLLFC